MATTPSRLTFQLERTTKGAVRYQETGADGKPLADNYAIGTLYIRKDMLQALGLGTPDAPATKIAVTVSA